VCDDKNSAVSLISDLRHDVDEICALLGYYAASRGDCLPTFRDIEDGTDTLSRNVGKQLPHDTAQYPRTAQISMLLSFKHVHSIKNNTNMNIITKIQDDN
jgi:hypothetical protein